MDPRFVMMMQPGIRQQLQLEMRLQIQMEAQRRAAMTDEQRAQMEEQQRMRMTMMAARRPEMMMMAARQEQIMAERMGMGGNGAGGPMPPIGMGFPRGPLFFQEVWADREPIFGTVDEQVFQMIFRVLLRQATLSLLGLRRDAPVVETESLKSYLENGKSRT